MSLSFEKLYNYINGSEIKLRNPPFIPLTQITDKIHECIKVNIHYGENNYVENNSPPLELKWHQNESGKLVSQYKAPFQSKYLMRRKGADIIADVFFCNKPENYCVTRFCTIKEYMHVFDKECEHEYTNEKNFEQVLLEYFLDIERTTEAVQAEYRAEDMALSLLCREKERKEYQKKIADKRIRHESIATDLRIPLKYVDLLLRDDFKERIDTIIKRDLKTPLSTRSNT